MPRLPKKASAPARRAAGPAAVCSQTVPGSAGEAAASTRPARRAGTWTFRGESRMNESEGSWSSHAESSPSR